MKKLKSIFCQAYNDNYNSDITHIDEIQYIQFKGRDLFNFCELYAGRAELEYGKKHRKKAFRKGILIGLIVGAVVAILSGVDLYKECEMFITNLNLMLWQR